MLHSAARCFISSLSCSTAELPIRSPQLTLHSLMGYPVNAAKPVLAMTVLQRPSVADKMKLSVSEHRLCVNHRMTLASQDVSGKEGGV